jgi:hypothetical protein
VDGASASLFDLLFTYVECPHVYSGTGWMLLDKPPRGDYGYPLANYMYGILLRASTLKEGDCNIQAR